jgi:ATP-dependent DNA ligase
LKLNQGPSQAIYHIPIKPMIGKPVGSATDIQSTLGKKVDPKRLVAEFKYDGERT